MVVVNQCRALFLASCLSAAASAQNATLPIVDLGYELHQAAHFDSVTNLYNFSNVRYAAPPVGDLRFAAPQVSDSFTPRTSNHLSKNIRIIKVPAVNRSVLQRGDVGRICAQGSPDWFTAELSVVPDLLSGNSASINVSEATKTLQGLRAQTSAQVAANSSALLANQDPRVSEDCLFLDVFAPKDAFDLAGKGYGNPVMVYIHGGFASGSKADTDPTSLLDQAKIDGENIVFVTINYRLGAFGWLSGPEFQASGGIANAGLHDQRLALEWVQKNIHLFGGDPNRVTIMGSSAGASSVLHQITAYGGKKSPGLFAQAILESPGFAPMPSAIQQQKTFDQYMSYLNVTSLTDARQLPSQALLAANSLSIALAPFGSFGYSIAVDGDFVPALPGQLLANGFYDKSIKNIMTGHALNEALGFTDPTTQNDTAFRNSVIGNFPSLATYPDEVDYIVNTLYPPIFDGSQAQNYTTQLLRASAFNSEVSLTCSNYHLNKAFANSSYGYEFAVPPSLHVASSASIFTPTNVLRGNMTSNIDWKSPLDDAQIAYAMQSYITRFVATGNPNKDGIAEFGIYGGDNSVIVVNTTGIVGARTSVANERCDFLQKGLFY
ncbi:carboxylesterase family protein-like protein [Aureobasidium pullulans]|nr:carboxylesterase family protein-like protein [Aureobasidium pullulans]